MTRHQHVMFVAFCFFFFVRTKKINQRDIGCHVSWGKKHRMRPFLNELQVLLQRYVKDAMTRHQHAMFVEFCS